MKMNKELFIGMGIGAAVGGGLAMLAMPEKKNVKSAVEKTLRTMGDAADSVISGMKG